MLSKIKRIFILWIVLFILVVIITKTVNLFNPNIDIENYWVTLFGTLIVAIAIQFLKKN